MKFRLYIDEVGNGDLKGAAKDPNVRFLSLTGVLTRTDIHEKVIQPEIDSLKHRLFGHTPQIPVVLHRREIMRKEGPFSVLHKNSVLDEFNYELFASLEKFSYRVITIQIDKQAHLENYNIWHFDPYHYCLRCMIERYALYLQYNKLKGDVMIEARNKNSDKKLKASFAKIYENGTENMNGRSIRRVLLSKDIMMKPKTANIAGLQIADLLAHPSARHMRFEREGVPHPEDFGTKIAKMLIDKKYRRDPRTFRIDGYGLKWLP
ncbi:MAG: DUF3800 domain-containing protein [Rhodoblastus sp.]|uniref:DUF3800 domain-containing protein n=1 Tax=Rhodoblastus sp. TaxID=1962975 RepID=UPI003F9B8EE0